MTLGPVPNGSVALPETVNVNLHNATDRKDVSMKPVAITLCLWPLCVLPLLADESTPKSDHMLLDVLGEELEYATQNLKMPDGTKSYYMAYTIIDRRSVSIHAEMGALVRDELGHQRTLDVDVRVGDYKLDNTHKLRGGGFGFDPSDMFSQGATSISIEDNAAAIKHAIWLATDRTFKSAAKKFQRVQTNLKTKVEEEDKSDDFSKEDVSASIQPGVALSLDREVWNERLRNASRITRKYPLVYISSVSLNATALNRYMVTSEGTRLQTGHKYLRVQVSAATKAEDGMNLRQNFIFSSSSEDGLPSEAEITEAFQKVINQVLALREAPLVEPYTGPGILVNRASAVFFHEIFGHRVEGHRQKDVEEGQTFTKKIGTTVLPEFISVHDNPTLATFGHEDLRGYYTHDDEGLPATDVTLVDKGVLKTFLLSRSPVEGFPKSNGHGRRQPGNDVVARQGNLVVTSTKTVPFQKLRELLIEECKSQGKPHGLMFEDITGGFTSTRRRGPQTFKILPVVVYRVYADGRPDELVRGVDIVGTPLSCFSKITWTGDDPGVFNGTCGAESGWVPVSAISPSILVSEIEIEKRRRSQNKPPILEPPISGAADR